MVSSATFQGASPRRSVQANGVAVKIITGDADIAEGLAALLEVDPRLEPIAARAGPLPLRLNEPGFAGLAHIIVSQMVSRASADAIWRRIVLGTGEVMTAEAYLAVSPEVSAGFGLSRAKAETLLRVAQAVVDGVIDLHHLSRIDVTAAMSELTSVRGIGPWTAEVYLMFCGGHCDVFPSGDVALQAAVAHGMGLEARPSAKMLASMAAEWSPWRSVAARLFWAYYASITRRDATPLP
jgi:DNA-3-methyladenine glycosylase II